MPLDAEFRHHLHELMVETSDKLREELNEHKRKLVWDARQTHNSAAIPTAYSKASIHAYRTRVSATIASYLGALETFSIDVDNSIEQEMLGLIGQLTGAHPSLTMPPGVKPPNLSSIRTAHKMELMRLGNSLQREAANRLREIKIKARRTRPAVSSATTTMTRTEPFTIASVAKTLAELKALPVADQAMLLLRILVRIEQQVRSDGGFSKHNLSMPGDHWGLARGFPDSENEAVRLHLLGTPWTRLVNDGFLVDPRGHGFFLVSEEGRAASETRPLAASGEKDINKDADGIPSAFISYSWDSDDHKLWVRQLAEQLRIQGVNVILDQWHLKIGGDRTHFMESSIKTSDFVVIVCTPIYAKKANSRGGGVGYEAMVITSQLAQDILQLRFIPVLRAGEWTDSAIPVWLGGKIGVDLRGDPYKQEEYECLLRTLHKAHDPAPPIGPRPVFKTHIIDNAVTALLEREGETTTPPLAIATNTGTDEPQLSPIAYAWYEKAGTNDRIQVYVRPTSDQQFRFEPSAGEIVKGTETMVAQRYLTFDLELRQKGYTRMQTFNGSGGRAFNLP
jgi:TIR domain